MELRKIFLKVPIINCSPPLCISIFANSFETNLLIRLNLGRSFSTCKISLQLFHLQSFIMSLFFVKSYEEHFAHFSKITVFWFGLFGLGIYLVWYLTRFISLSAVRVYCTNFMSDLVDTVKLSALLKRIPKHLMALTKDLPFLTLLIFFLVFENAGGRFSVM